MRQRFWFLCCSLGFWKRVCGWLATVITRASLKKFELEARISWLITTISGEFTKAREPLQRACDLDELPARADSRVNALIEEAAREFSSPKLVLCDAAARLGGGNPSGICGDETFYEHVHFKPEGSYRLGKAWAEEVEKQLPPATRSQSAGPWASESLCERRLALTDWNRRNDLNEVAARRRRPPLNGQSNNGQELAQLDSELSELGKRMDVQGAEEARRLCLEAISRAPADMDLHGNFADLLEALGDWKGAAGQWRQVEQLLPQYYLAHFQEGRMLERQGELGRARAAFEQALALRPGMAQAWFELSNLSASEGKLEAAWQEVEKAQKLQPNQAVFYACQGKLLSRMGRPAEAVGRFREAVKVDPTFLDGRIALGNELAGLGRLDEARLEFEAGTKLRPDSAVAHLDLGAVLARQDRFPEARREFEQALRLEPANVRAQEYLARVEALMKEGR